jgi:hypothetical protein
VFSRQLAVLATIMIALSVILALVIPFDYVNAQVNQNGQNTLFAPNNNKNAGNTSNSTGIMKNTSGMLDEAFDALRNTFGSFFGK